MAIKNPSSCGLRAHEIIKKAYDRLLEQGIGAPLEVLELDFEDALDTVTALRLNGYLKQLVLGVVPSGMAMPFLPNSDVLIGDVRALAEELKNTYREDVRQNRLGIFHTLSEVAERAKVPYARGRAAFLIFLVEANWYAKQGFQGDDFTFDLTRNVLIWDYDARLKSFESPVA